MQVLGTQKPLGAYDTASIRFVDREGVLMRPRMRMDLDRPRWWWHDGERWHERREPLTPRLLATLMADAGIDEAAWTDAAAPVMLEAIAAARQGRLPRPPGPAFTGTRRDANAIWYPHPLAWPAAILLVILAWKIGVVAAIWRWRRRMVAGNIRHS